MPPIAVTILRKSIGIVTRSAISLVKLFAASFVLFALKVDTPGAMFVTLFLTFAALELLYEFRHVLVLVGNNPDIPKPDAPAEADQQADAPLISADAKNHEDRPAVSDAANAAIDATVATGLPGLSDEPISLPPSTAVQTA